MTFLGLDLVEGAKLANKDKYGDWYRDPWGWPECYPEFISRLEPESIVPFDRHGTSYVYSGAPAFHPFEVPKSFLGTRPAVVQDPLSRLAYVTAALSLGPTLHRSLPEWVFGWRFRADRYANSNDEWAAYDSSKQPVMWSSFAAQSDITSFFASVDVEVLVKRVRALVGSKPAVSVVEGVLRAHDALTSRRGLPQRSVASSILAQLAMSPIDDEIARSLASGAILSARRWMDDLSFEGDEVELYALLIRLQGKAREAGLEVQAAKTLLTTGWGSWEALQEEAQKRIPVRELEGRTGSEYFDDSSLIDPTELLELEARVLANPRQSSRSLANAVLRSLTRYEIHDRARDWISASPSLPHAADGLSRYLASARSDLWNAPDVVAWFEASSYSGWSTQDWVLAQHALVFRSDDLPTSVATCLRGWLESSNSLQKLAVAVHRLSVVEPATVRAAVTTRADSVSDPLVLRLLALGYLASGGQQHTVSTMLSHHPANALTRRYLEEHDWRLPPVSKDFDHASEPEQDGATSEG